MNAAFDAANALRGLLAGFTQDSRLLRLTTRLTSADALLVERVDGSEGLSEGFCFTITALSTIARLDIDQLLGQPALLQILTQHSRNALRPLHGHITRIESVGSDGGLARYRLTLEPWLAFLRHRRDCYVWQDKSALDIVQEIFRDYAGKGALVPAWRLDLADPSQYAVREVCTQFEESDLAFVERLLAEEGLFYWFEHAGDPGDAGFGSHTLVIADHNGAFPPNAQAAIPFQLPSAVEQVDSITAWHAEAHIATNAITLASWNERQVAVIEARLDSATPGEHAPTLDATDFPGSRRFASQVEAERHTRLQLEAIEAQRTLWRGSSTVRTIAPGTTFTLQDAGGLPQAQRHAIVRVQHQARNNLTSEARTLIAGLFDSDHASEKKDDKDTPLYANRFTAARADVSWRARTRDGSGLLLHPRPTVTGVQTAIVVGVAGHDLTTERNHRIKVQMHWQRGTRSHSRLAHDGDNNATGNDAAYVWVRVATTMAGANFGSAFLPRIGQEVVLDYLEGDIDRPLITGSLYNGRGTDDAQGNQVVQGAGAATGNAPAWFAGNGHNAVLAGFKTQEIGHSQDGSGGHNQLIFDDSTAQVGLRVQTTQHATQLNLGHIKRQRDNIRTASHGHGAELSTDAYGALRAGQGLLISADLRPNAGGAQMDAQEAQAQLQQALELQTALADSARQQNAFTGKTLNPQQHDQPEQALQKTLESLAQTQGGGDNSVPAFGRPDLVASAPAGMAILTPGDTHLTANAITLTGDIDVSTTAGHHFTTNAKSGISLYTAGDAKAGRKTQGDVGIKLHAASGKLKVQANSGQLAAAADKDVNIASTEANVTVAGKQHVLLTAGGAYLKIDGGNIRIHAPGKVEFKAGSKVLSGPQGMNTSMPELPVFAPTKFSQQLYVIDPTSGSPQEVSHRLFDGDKEVLKGITDTAGKIPRQMDDDMKNMSALIGPSSSWSIEYLASDTPTPNPRDEGIDHL